MEAILTAPVSPNALKKRKTKGVPTNHTYHSNGEPNQVVTPVQSNEAISFDPIWPISVEQYHTMLQVGILVDGDPVELLEGRLVQKMTKKRPHSIATGETKDMLDALIPNTWYVESQDAITLDDSEPEPDIAVIRGNRRQYVDRHPNAQEIGLIVEVADATLLRDRGVKKRIYARAGILVYWLINLPERQIEVYTEPGFHQDRHDYAQKRVYSLTEEVPFTLDGIEIGRIPVQSLLP